MGHPNSSQRFRRQIEELANQSFICCHSRKKKKKKQTHISRSLFQHKSNHASFRDFHKILLLPDDVSKMQDPLDIFRPSLFWGWYFTAAPILVPGCRGTGNHDSSFLVCSSTPATALVCNLHIARLQVRMQDSWLC